MELVYNGYSYGGTLIGWPLCAGAKCEHLAGHVMPKLLRAKTSPAGPILAGQKWSGTNYGEPKLVRPDQFWSPKVVPLGSILADQNWSGWGTKFGRHSKNVQVVDKPGERL